MPEESFALLEQSRVIKWPNQHEENKKTTSAVNSTIVLEISISHDYFRIKKIFL